MTATVAVRPTGTGTGPVLAASASTRAAGVCVTPQDTGSLWRSSNREGLDVRLITEWSTDDPKLAKTLELIADAPEHSVERQELEAALHMFQARLCWERADRYRRQDQQRAAQQRRRDTRKKKAALPAE